MSECCQRARELQGNIIWIDAIGAAQAMRKLHAHLRAAKEAAMERTLPKVREISMAPHAQTVDQDLDEAAEVWRSRLTSFRHDRGCYVTARC